MKRVFFAGVTALLAACGSSSPSEGPDGGTPDSGGLTQMVPGWNPQGILSGPNGAAADHPVLIDNNQNEVVGFEYASAGGAPLVSLEHWNNAWVPDLTGVHPSATARLMAAGTGLSAGVVLADDPASPAGAYVFTDSADTWSQFAAPINPTGLAMERPRFASCNSNFTSYLAFQAGSDIYVEQTTDRQTWTLTAGGKVPLPAGISNVLLSELFCTSNNGVSRPFLVLEAILSGASNRVVLTYDLGFDSSMNDAWNAQPPITAPSGFDAVDPVVGGHGLQPYLAFVIPGAEAGLDRIQVMSYDRNNDRWTPVGGYVNAVAGQSVGHPRMVEASGPVVAFTESDGSSQKLYFMTWDGSNWVPYDQPLGAAAGDTLAISGNGFGLAGDSTGTVEVAYPEDTPQGRRIVVQFCYHP